MGGAAVGLLRRKDSPWATPALYALGASALISVALAAGAIWSIRPAVLSAFPSSTTPGDVEEHVKEWLDHANWMAGPGPSDNSDAYFTLRVRFGNDHEVIIKRPKLDGQSLLLGAKVFLGEQHQAILRQAQKSQVEALARHLQMGLVRQNLTYSNIIEPFNNMILEKRLPISGLNEYIFRDEMEKIDFGIILVVDAVNDELQSWQKTH